MASTPNYNLPLFETNDIPSWLRDWNSAMTTIDTSIKAVANEMQGFDTDVQNAVNTANSAAGQVTQLSDQVTTLNNRVSALEEGGSGGGGGVTIDQVPNGVIIENVVNSWQQIGSVLIIPQAQASINLQFGGDSDDGNQYILAEEIRTSQGTMTGMNIIPVYGGRLNAIVTDFNSGEFPVTTRLLTGSRRVNGGRWIVNNAYTINMNLQPPSTGSTAGGNDLRVTISAGLNVSPSSSLQLSIAKLSVYSNGTLQYPRA